MKLTALYLCTIFFSLELHAQTTGTFTDPRDGQSKAEKILTGTDEKLRSLLCKSIPVFEFDVYSDLNNQKFQISSFERKIYYFGLNGNRDEMFSDLSQSALFQQFKMFENFWEEKNIWRYTCTDKDHPLFMQGEYSIVQYIAILVNDDLFFRLFQSGAYNLDLLNAPINGKNQTLFEWLKESIEKNPSNFSKFKLLAFERYRDIILKKYPGLEYRSEFKTKTGTFTDPRDGQTYNTISIQKPALGTTVTWLADNLNYNMPGSYAPNNKENLGSNKFGLLYTWDAAQKACPSGWHLPQAIEWATLVIDHGGGFKAGNALKSNTGWSENGNGSNSSNFNAQPTGFRNSEGSFFDKGKYGYWWTSSPAGEGRAWSWRLSHANAEVNHKDYTVYFGHSVRCVKD